VPARRGPTGRLRRFHCPAVLIREGSGSVVPFDQQPTHTVSRTLRGVAQVADHDVHGVEGQIRRDSQCGGDREEVVITRAGREPVVRVALDDYETLNEPPTSYGTPRMRGGS